MENNTKTDLSKYIVSVSGKDFITFPGLLAEAHAQGLLAVETQLVNEDPTNPIMKATVHMKGETLPSGQSQVKLFTGYGDANANNVAKKVSGALIRMAETRSIARALRFACNINLTALEEIGVDDDEAKPVPAKSLNRPSVPVRTTNNTVDISVDQRTNGTGSNTLEASTDTLKTNTVHVESKDLATNSSVQEKNVVKRSFNKRSPQQTSKEPNFP